MWEGPYEIAKVYNYGSIWLKGVRNTPRIMNGKCLQLCLADEQQETKELNFIMLEEAKALEEKSIHSTGMPN